ncbi:MAG: hypothetical protein GTO45_12330 [Candidatus Aminicenantes bacterium]|nr:hypothetical protein [Candidatus Aminicenantes bacterium]NIM79590.1 hypothetical protein [Candidatus Aminicenantes bacterium]NIN18899.1 hypothetical protein [Candidatus Aminicenantes bacterium]NIN42809.1 hypothetical protein [Candidatus Aminicenantes bacterium]NIN85536.1 hypothetical protein [Candidatus Aminicenantes bacterium]
MWDSQVAYAEVVGNLGYKDKAMDVLLVLAEDETQECWLRRSCAETVGKLGEKEKALDILINLYMAQKDKYEMEARRIYNSLWEMTAI